MLTFLLSQANNSKAVKNHVTRTVSNSILFISFCFTWADLFSCLWLLIFIHPHKAFIASRFQSMHFAFYTVWNKPLIRIINVFFFLTSLSRNNEMNSVFLISKSRREEVKRNIKTDYIQRSSEIQENFFSAGRILVLVLWSICNWSFSLYLFKLWCHVIYKTN